MEKVWEVIKKVFVWIWNLIKSVFLKEETLTLFFKALEIAFAGLLAVGICRLVDIWFWKYTAVAVVGIVFYFFSPIIKPYFDRARKYIISKATGIDWE